MPPRNAENEVCDATPNVEESNNTDSKINGDFGPTVEGEDPVVEE